MKPFRNIGITSKLVSILVFFSLIPLSVQVYSLYETVGLLEKDVGVQYQTIADGVTRNLQTFLAERAIDAQSMSRSRILRDRTLWYKSGSENNEIIKVLNEYVQTSGAYFFVQIVDREGRLIAVNDRDSEGQPLHTGYLYGKTVHSTPWFQGLQQQIGKISSEDVESDVLDQSPVFVEDVLVDQEVKALFPQSNGLTVGFSVPIYEGGVVIGYWAQRLKYSMVENIIQHAYLGLKKAGFQGAELTLQNGQGFTILEYAPSVHQNDAVIHDLENVLFRTNLAQLGMTGCSICR